MANSGTAKVNEWFAVDSNDQPTGDPHDVILAYETYGDPAADPVILCPGLVVCPQLVSWGSDFCEALAAAGFFVIAYDARDSGLSTKLDVSGDPPIAKIYAEKQLGIKMERKDGIPYFITCAP